jgi:hypothetical protein
MKFNFKTEFEKACKQSSDINEHLPILLEACRDVEHVTEMGVRTGVSSLAFFYGDPKKYIAYDLRKDPRIEQMFEYARSLGKDYTYIENDVLNVEIEETDLLFIDTYHCYEQLRKELELHSDKVRKYIIFHDTFTYGRNGENLSIQSFSGTKGILYAIEEFLEENPQWKIVHDVDYNNGLMIIEKKA